MKAWMLSIVDLVRPSPRHRQPAGRAARTATRTARSWSVSPASCEALEGRALLATSSVVPFATLTGQVAANTQTSQVVLHINAGEFQSSQSPTVLLGFYVEPTAGSAVSPKITQVTGPNGQITPLNIPNHGNSAADKLARQTHLFARVIPLSGQAQDITLNVASLNKQAGSYTVEAYLAGDVNDDGKVDSSDVSALQVSYGSYQSQINYNAAADFNGDGRVGCIDRKLTTINLGAQFVETAVTPAVAATASVPLTTTTASVPLATTTASVPVATATSVPLATAPTEVSLYPAPTAATVPASSTTIPIAVASPVTYATPAASATSTGYVPITLTPSSAIPVAATSTATSTGYVPITLTPSSAIPVAATSTATSTGYVPVTLMPTSAMPMATTPTATSTGYVPATLAPTVAMPMATTSSAAPVVLTPVYPTAAATSYPVATSTASATPVYMVAQPTTTSTPPIYVYGQPVAATTAGTTGTTLTPGATLFGQTGSTAATSTATPLPVYLYNTPRTS